MDNVYTIDEIKKNVVPIAKAHDVGRIYLFGSYARGEATPSSDIDLSGQRQFEGIVCFGRTVCGFGGWAGKEAGFADNW